MLPAVSSRLCRNFSLSEPRSMISGIGIFALVGERGGPQGWHRPNHNLARQRTKAG
jgi:hypothetical protein